MLPINNDYANITKFIKMKWNSRQRENKENTERRRKGIQKE